MIASSGPVPTNGPSPSAAPQSVEPAASNPVSLDLVGTVLSDRYRVLKKLGEGGMGSVYLAEHTTINKKLAIKVLSAEYSHKQDLVDRFLQEARAASMIDQQNVVEITDFGSTPTGSVYFVMEFLNGEDLSGTIKKNGPLSWGRVKPIMLQICSALEAAHDAGIIHRDMKPENCYRIRRGNNEDFIKVLDFGIAKVTSDENEGGKNLTRTGMIFGTPEYMSPEQAKGEKVDVRVDVYATGVIMYELLTGRVPFTADTFMGILTKHMFEAPPAPSTVVPGVEIPEEVEAIILKALQKDREYRFQSMRDMANAIEAVGTGAAAVSVVAESVSAPARGHTDFARRPTGEMTSPGGGSKAPLFIGLGVVAVALAGLGGAYAAGLFDNGGDDGTPVAAAPKVVESPEPNPAPEPTPTPPADDPEVNVAGVDPKPEPPPVPAKPTEVEITIETPGLEATVYDNRDDAKLGVTNEAFTLPFGDQPFEVYVQAEGHETQLLEFVPDANKTFEASLPELPKRKGKRPRRARKPRKPKHPEPTKETPAEPKPTPTVKPKTTTPKPKATTTPRTTSSSPDLKNPFG